MIGTLVVSRTSSKLLSKTLSPGVFSPREIQNTSFVQNGLQVKEPIVKKVFLWIPPMES
jgi:hypothetical protein